MSVLFTGIFSAASIAWDREFGFLREMLAAPVSRSAIVIGKRPGGAIPGNRHSRPGIKQIQEFMALTQMLVMPLFLLPGALYPLRSLPGWLTVLTWLDPITRVVYPLPRAVFSHLSVSPAAASALSPAVTWNGRAVAEFKRAG
jgi:ABC-2 type transport system permease protein